MRLLFICTGNTCRSPMAQVLACAAAAEYGLNLEIESAGLAAMAGEAASQGAQRAMADRGLSLDGHRARQFQPEMADTAIILAMTPGHAARLRALSPRADIHTLGEWGGTREAVSDPFGGDLACYEACAQQLDRLIRAGLERMANKREK